MNQKSKAKRFIALFVTLAMMAAMLPTVAVSANVDLGDFNAPHNWAPGWNSDGRDDQSYPLQWDSVASATQLVVVLSAEPEDTNIQLVFMSEGNGWSWTQHEIWDTGDGTTITVDLDGVPNWSSFASEGPGMFALGGLGGNENLLVSASLVTAGGAAEPTTPDEPEPTPEPAATPAPPVTPQVADGLSVLALVLESTTYTLNGATRTLEVAPRSIDGRTMVPFRFIGETMGADIGWDDATRTASFSLGARSASVTIDEPLPGGMGTPIIYGGRTLVPVRFVAEAMGAEVEWIGETSTVIVTFGEAAPPVTPPVTVPAGNDDDDTPAENGDDDENGDEDDDDDDDEDEDDTPATPAGPVADPGTPPTGNVVRGEQRNDEGHGSIQFNVDVTPGGTYTLSFWVRNAPGREIMMAQWSHWPQNYADLGDGAPAPAEEWAFVEFEFDVPASNNYLLQVVPADGEPGDVFYVADVTITSADGTAVGIPLSALRAHWDASSFAVSTVSAPN